LCAIQEKEKSPCYLRRRHTRAVLAAANRLPSPGARLPLVVRLHGLAFEARPMPVKVFCASRLREPCTILERAANNSRTDNGIDEVICRKEKSGSFPWLPKKPSQDGQLGPIREEKAFRDS
jgi:hypothetical protein